MLHWNKAISQVKLVSANFNRIVDFVEPVTIRVSTDHTQIERDQINDFSWGYCNNGHSANYKQVTILRYPTRRIQAIYICNIRQVTRRVEEIQVGTQRRSVEVILHAVSDGVFGRTAEVEGNLNAICKVGACRSQFGEVNNHIGPGHTRRHQQHDSQQSQNPSLRSHLKFLNVANAIDRPTDFSKWRETGNKEPQVQRSLTHQNSAHNHRKLQFSRTRIYIYTNTASFGSYSAKK